jgi:hypothetical protein
MIDVALFGLPPAVREHAPPIPLGDLSPHPCRWPIPGVAVPRLPACGRWPRFWARLLGSLLPCLPLGLLARLLACLLLLLGLGVGVVVGGGVVGPICLL